MTIKPWTMTALLTSVASLAHAAQPAANLAGNGVHDGGASPVTVGYDPTQNKSS